MHPPITCCALFWILLCTACTTPGQRASPPAGRPSASAPSTLPGSPPGPGPGSASGPPPSGAALPPASTTPSAPITAPFIEHPSAGAVALNEGVAAFYKGEYGRADSKIKQGFLQGLTNTPDLVRGYKTIAFVNCVTQRIVQCEKSFEAAIAVDRRFDLSPHERNHPAWGAVFAKVRKRFPA